jgi:hypothetical protein
MHWFMWASFVFVLVGCSFSPTPSALSPKQCQNVIHGITLKSLVFESNRLAYTHDEVELYLKNALLKTGCFAFRTASLFSTQHPFAVTFSSDNLAEQEHTFVSTKRNSTLQVIIMLEVPDMVQNGQTLVYRAKSVVELQSHTVMGIELTRKEHEKARRKVLILAVDELARKVAESVSKPKG